MINYIDDFSFKLHYFYMTHEITWLENNLRYSTQFRDHFYSQENGLGETRNVFMNGNGLPRQFSEQNHVEINEPGSGTGLDFLETWSCWIKHRKEDQRLNFTPIKGFAMRREALHRAQQYWPQLSHLSDGLFPAWQCVRRASFKPEEQTTLRILCAPGLEAFTDMPANINAWYLDGFSPAKNPDMWSSDVCRELARCTATGGTLASYTSAGRVRCNLENAGFEIPTAPDYDRKRHMITGRFGSQT